MVEDNWEQELDQEEVKLQEMLAKMNKANDIFATILIVLSFIIFCI